MKIMNIAKNIEKIRDDIYGLDYITFLDTAGQCPILKNQTEASKEFWNYYTSIGAVTHGDPPITPATKCQGEAAKIINADEKDIIMIPRPNHAFNIIKDIIPWKKGDNIVFTDLGYPDSGSTWLSLREKGVELRQIKNVNGRILPSDMEKAVDENTKIVVVNRTTWACGFTYDMNTVCNIAHEYGAYVVDDFFQTSQVININEPPVDFAFTGSWKWLMGPHFATGFLYITPEIQDKFVPTYMTYGVHDVPEETNISLFTSGFRGPQTYKFAYRNPKHDNILHYVIFQSLKV
jgi:selenocysteine lyase/cysteine desulfurase